MWVTESKKRMNREEVWWLLYELGIGDIAEIENISVPEFMERYSDRLYSNTCMDKLLQMGKIYIPEGEKRVNDLQISTRLRNILLGHNVYLISQITKYSREDVMDFRHLGKEAMKELDAICEQEGIRLMSVYEIGERMAEVEFTPRQLRKLYNAHVWYPEDFLNLTEEQYQGLTWHDNSMVKKIKKVQKLYKK